MDIDELDNVARELRSLLAKCESALEGSSLDSSQRTLMTNRVAALMTAVSLVEGERAEL